MASDSKNCGDTGILRRSKWLELLGCTDRHYQKIEYGYVNVPSLTLIKLADFFGVTTDYLLGRSELPTQEEE